MAPRHGHSDDQARWSLLRGGLILIGSEAGAKLLGMILMLAMARTLGAGEFGLYAFGIALSNALLLPSNFGLERLAQREIPRAPHRAPSLYPAFVALKSLLSAAALGLALAVLGGLGHPPHRAGVLLAIFFASLGQSYLALNAACFRALGRPRDDGLTRLGFALSNSLLGLTALWLGYGLPGVVLVLLLTTWATLLTSTATIHRATGATLAGARAAECRRIFRQALPFAFLVVFLLLYTQLDVLLLGLFRRHEEVGFYTAAAKLLELLTMIPAAAMGVFLPAMSRHYQGSRTSCQGTLENTWKYLSVLALPAATGTFLLADRIIPLCYGPSYTPSSSALRLLAWAIVPIFLNFIAFNTLIAMGRERALLAITAAGSLVTLLANSALIPVLGFLAPSAIAFWTQAVVLVLSFREILRHGAGVVRLTTLGRLMVRPALGASWMALVLSVSPGLPLALLVALGGAAYVAFLFAAGTFRDELGVGAGAVAGRQGAPA